MVIAIGILLIGCFIAAAGGGFMDDRPFPGCMLMLAAAVINSYGFALLFKALGWA